MSHEHETYREFRQALRRVTFEFRTQDDAAAFLGVTPRTFRSWLKETNTPPINTQDAVIYAVERWTSRKSAKLGGKNKLKPERTGKNRPSK